MHPDYPFHKYSCGDIVKIEGFLTQITHLCIDMPGGYKVDPPVDGIKYWNEDEMEFIK